MIVLISISFSSINNIYYPYRGGEIANQIIDNGIKDSMTEVSTNSCEVFSNDLNNSGHEIEDDITSENIEVK